MTDEAPPSQWGNGKRPPAEADLDTALWPDPPARPRRSHEAQPVSTVPEPRPIKATISPNETQRPGPSAPRTDSQAPASEGEHRPGSGDRLADAVPLSPMSSSTSMTSKATRMPARDRLRLERERRARRRRWIRASVVGAAVVVLIAAAVVAIALQRDRHTARKADFGYAGPYAPVTLNADNSVTMAQPGVTKPVVNVYEDFQCPMCRAFEKTNGGMIQQLADRGKVKVVYYPFTIFSGQPQQANSVRAWAAAKCAPPSRWVRYHNALYASQPAETTVDGFPVSLLVRLGKKVGITSPGFAQCVRSQDYAAQNAPLSDQIMNGGVSRMPTLTLNGQVLHVSPTSPGLRKQILSRS